MVTLQKEGTGKNITKGTIVQIQKDVKKGKRYASLRLWLGSIAFTTGIMALIMKPSLKLAEFPRKAVTKT